MRDNIFKKSAKNMHTDNITKNYAQHENLVS